MLALEGRLDQVFGPDSVMSGSMESLNGVRAGMHRKLSRIHFLHDFFNVDVRITLESFHDAAPDEFPALHPSKLLAFALGLARNIRLLPRGFLRFRQFCVRG